MLVSTFALGSCNAYLSLKMGHFLLQSAKELLYRSVCSKAMNILLSEIAAFIILNQSPISLPWNFGSLRNPV